MNDSLFSVVFSIYSNANIAITEDENTFVRQLRSYIQHNSELNVLYGYLTKEKGHVLHKGYLPLIGRMIQCTIGLVDASHHVIEITHQWLSSTNDFPEVIQIVDDVDGVVTYRLDFDEDYIAKYEEFAYANHLRITYDTISVHIGEAGSSDAHVSRSSSEHNHSTSTVIDLSSSKSRTIRHEVEKKKKLYTHNHRTKQQFINIWADTYHFEQEASVYPNVLHNDFHQKLYQTDTFAFAEQKVSHPNQSIVTYKDHQKFVRNFISPMTPYHSLLMVHSTGTGKTFTTLGITEQFRDITFMQNKKIHIACPRREISDEFLSYIKSDTYDTEDPRVANPKEYIYEKYVSEYTASSPQSEKQIHQYAQQHYNITNYYSVFPKRYYSFMSVMQTIVYAWYTILPNINHIVRHNDGFIIQAPPIQKHQEQIVFKSFENVATTYTDDFGETLKYTFKPSSKKLKIHVHSESALLQFEKHIVHTYANTLFVVDEAHRLIGKDVINTAIADETDEESSVLFALQFVIGILRHNHHRMRLLLLTATPMRNSSQDLIRLLNLMIHNDGLSHEMPIDIVNKSMRFTEDNTNIIKSLKARVSFFQDNAGKPKQITVEECFYNVPSIRGVRVSHGNYCQVLVVDKQSTFFKEVASTVPHYCVCNQLKARDAFHGIPIDALEKPITTQKYVYIVLNPSFSTKQQEAWCKACGIHIHSQHALIVLCSSNEYAKQFSNNATLCTLLFHNTSIRKPLLFKHASHKSHYTCNAANPHIYSPQLHNMHVFFQKYYQHTQVTEKDFYSTPSIVTTPMQNDAFMTSDTHKSLRYSFAGQKLNNWNVHDATDTIYQPKIDTMMNMMECLPGNVLVYTNEVQLGEKGSRALLFLKRLIEKRFHHTKHSRLSNVVVEILHKETLIHMKDDERSNVLNQRIEDINRALLAQRNDIVLIGSAEIMEGLTMNEIRQVHILDACWNMAQMQQVIGRAIRIKNHRKLRHTQLHNVCCFLHVSVPEEDVFNQEKLLHTSMSRMSISERLIGDLHRFRNMQKKIEDVEHASSLVQIHAIDSVLQKTAIVNSVSVLSSDDQVDIKSFPWRVLQKEQLSHKLIDIIAVSYTHLTLPTKA